MLTLLDLLQWCQAQSPRATTPYFSPRHGEPWAPLSQPPTLAFSLKPTKLKGSLLCWQLDPFWLWLPSSITLLFWVFWLDDAKQNSAEFFRQQTAFWNKSAPATHPWVATIIHSQKAASNRTPSMFDTPFPNIRAYSWMNTIPWGCIKELIVRACRPQ